MPTSPSILNYFTGTGYATFTPSGGSARDLGNCVAASITPSSTAKEHKNQRSGKAKVDKTDYIDFKMELKLTLDEITLDNLKLLLSGSDITTNSDGTRTMTARAANVSGAITWTGTNSTGNKFSLTIPSIDFGPSGSFDLITAENAWGEIELTGSVNATDNSDGTSDFFTLTETAAS